MLAGAKHILTPMELPAEGYLRLRQTFAVRRGKFPVAPKADHIRSRGSFHIRPKIREKLARLYPDVHTPAISTVHAVLDRHGLVKRRGIPPRYAASPFHAVMNFRV
jgi:hypothetical protein